MTALTRSLTLRQLEIFTTAAHQGSFTRAAGALLLSEPAVSQQMKLLEKVVGAQLFERSPRRPIRLTDAGTILLQTCESVFREFDATFQQLEALHGMSTGRVSLGVGTSFGSYLLPPIVAAFREKYPGIAVAVTIEMSGHWDEKVRRREVDLAVMAGPTGEHDITSVPFAPKDLVWIGLPDHRLSSGGPYALEELAAEQLVLGPAQSSTRLALDQLAEKQGLVLHPTFELAGTEAFVTAVKSGMGIALVPHHVVLSRELSGSVAVLNVDGFPLRVNWFLIWRTDDDLSPGACAFRDYMLRDLKPN